ncbi:MAG: serine/threonine-protein kinase [Kofleriaceae bacterium]
MASQRAPADPTMSERTIGNYVLGPLLGRGGMSEVYAAEHRFLGDRVAIKLLRTQLASDPAAIDAFIAEANRTRAIEHGNVVRVLDFGSDDGDCYLVMERLDGESLAARIVRDGGLPEAEVRRLGAAIADGVAAAHERGIVHRDLKPGNIILTKGTPKIVDFGIARAFGGAGAAVTGSRVGSLAYMAPEQITEGRIAPSVDIWALGVILYEALSGRLPFDDFANGRTPQLFDQPPPLAGQAQVSPALDALIAACLQRDPARRPPSMRELAAQLRHGSDQRFTEDLAPVIGPVPVRAPTPRVAPETTEQLRGTRRPARTAKIAVLVTLGLVATASGWLWAARTADPVAAPARSAVLPSPPPTAAPAPTPPTADPAPITADRAPITADRRPTPSSADRAPPTADRAPPTADRAPPPPAAAGFTVEVRSAPPGAVVLLNNRRVGVTPATIPLAGPSALLVTHAGYRPVRVRALHAGALTVRLVATRRAPDSTAAGETLD